MDLMNIAGVVVPSYIGIFSFARKIAEDLEKRRMDKVAKRNDNPTRVQGVPRDGEE
jgi:hypothetical protein